MNVLLANRKSDIIITLFDRINEWLIYKLNRIGIGYEWVNWRNGNIEHATGIYVLKVAAEATLLGKVKDENLRHGADERKRTSERKFMFTRSCQQKKVGDVLVLVTPKFRNSKKWMKFN